MPQRSRLHLDHERARPARLGPPLARGAAPRRGRARSSGASGPTTRPTGCCPRRRACRPCGVFANQAMMAVIAAGHVEQLRAQADRDSLTGMLNRRAFMRELASEIERSLRYGRRFVARPLRPRRLQEHQRHRRPPGGRPRARGRRRAARGHRPRHATSPSASAATSSRCCCPRPTPPRRRTRSGGSWPRWPATACSPHGLGISFGLALFPIHGKTPEELIRRADQALYAAKRSDGDVQFAPRAA